MSSYQCNTTEDPRMAKIRMGFEGIPVQGYQFLGQHYGFTFGGLAAVDTTTPPYDAIEPHGGTAVAYPVVGVKFMQRGDLGDFKLRKAFFSDANTGDSTDTVLVRGYNNGQLVGEEFVFLNGDGSPTEHRFGEGFRSVDQVQFVVSNNTIGIDDIVVRVPDPPMIAASDDPFA
jgi:hypothetical protein